LHREFDPRAVLAAVERLLADLLTHAGDCEGIVVCGQMHGLVLTTERGEPRSTLTTWQDQHVLAPHPSGQGTYFDILRGRLSPDQVRQLGNEVRPGQPLGVLFWLAEQGRLPGGDLVPASLLDFVVANLCGTTPSTEVTNAMSHGALNLETLDWHHEVCSQLGVRGLRWPAIRQQGEVAGRLQSGGRAIPCYTPVGDYQCAMAGTLLARGELSLNISTGSQVSLLLPRAEFGDYQTRPFFDGRYLATITHIPAGRSLSALVRLLSELAEAQGLSLADPWPTIAHKAAEAGATDLRVDLAFYDSACGDQGAITGIREAELTVGHLFRAAFEGMADNYYTCATRLSPDQAWERLVFSGGLARNELLRQLVSERFQVGYRLCPTTEDTLHGLLALALAFTGRASSVKEATDLLREAHSSKSG
jgi:sugar (pentulose or hexulose) kinase